MKQILINNCNDCKYRVFVNKSIFSERLRIPVCEMENCKVLPFNAFRDNNDNLFVEAEWIKPPWCPRNSVDEVKE